MWELEERRGVWRHGLNEVLRYAVGGEKLGYVAECESDRSKGLIQLQGERCSFVLLCEQLMVSHQANDVRSTNHHPVTSHPALLFQCRPRLEQRPSFARPRSFGASLGL